MGVRPNEKRVFKNYKFIIKRTDMPHFQAFFTNYTQVKNEIGIPKTTFYAMMRGDDYKKWRNYTIEKCRIPVNTLTN